MMTEQPGSYTGQPERTAPRMSVPALRSECHRLIELIARRPGAAKLLSGLLPLLKMYSLYKTRQRRP